MKITEGGQPCRHCNTGVVICHHKPAWKPKPNQAYYYDYWLKCPACRTIYMVESAKRNTPGYIEPSAQPDVGRKCRTVIRTTTAKSDDDFCLSVLRECQPQDFPPEHVTNGAVTGAALTGSDSDPGGVTHGERIAGQYPVGA